MMPHLRNFIEIGEGHSLVEIEAPPALVGRTPAQLALRSKYDVNLVAIKRPLLRKPDAARPAGVELILPRPDTEIRSGDRLVLLGAESAVDKLPAE
jgi:trk system potassium uptake protein TrkA